MCVLRIKTKLVVLDYYKIEKKFLLSTKTITFNSSEAVGNHIINRQKKKYSELDLFLKK